MRSELQAVLDDLRDMATADIPALIGELAHLQASAQMRLIGAVRDETVVQHKISPAEFFSVNDIAARWRCSRGTVYNRLRSTGAMSLDFSSKKQSRSKRSIPRSIVLQVEERHTKRIC